MILTEASSTQVGGSKKFRQYEPYLGCVRFFGYLSAADPNCLRNYPIFTKSVMDMINHFDCLDPARRVLAFDTLAVVASTSEAKAFLNEPSEASKGRPFLT